MSGEQDPPDWCPALPNRWLLILLDSWSIPLKGTGGRTQLSRYPGPLFSGHHDRSPLTNEMPTHWSFDPIVRQNPGLSVRIACRSLSSPSRQR
jgi:hypothetical protein